MDEYPSTALHYAVRYNHKEVVKLLLVHGAKISIHASAKIGIQEKVEALLGQGVDINLKDSDGATSLHHAVWAGHDELTRFLIEQGADMYAKDRRGSTPLDLARVRGRAEIVKMLTKAAEEQKATEEQQTEGKKPSSESPVKGQQKIEQAIEEDNGSIKEN